MPQTPVDSSPLVHTRSDGRSTIPDTIHLCEYCKRFDVNIKAMCSGKTMVFPSRASIIASSSSCALCKYITESGLNSIPPTDGPLYTKSFMYYDNQNGICSFELSNDPDRVETADESLWLHVVATTDSPPAINRHVSGRIVPLSIDLGLAKTWLKDCLENHDHGPTFTAVRPARLIAVGRDDGSDAVRIADVSNLDKRYLALSHCWGGVLPLQTTKANLQAFKHAIPWDKIPNTFQDAIRVARTLEIGYIWIDALCIVQDDLADWDVESVKMASVYNNAILTIMAGSGSNSHKGLLNPRSWILNSVTIPYTDEESGTITLSIHINNLECYMDEIQKGPLYSRAWVLQERLISKRKLIFGEQQLYWVCDGHVEHETKIQPSKRVLGPHYNEESVYRIFANSQIPMPAPANHLWVWQLLLNDYSICSLTYESDKLPSLSGLARIYAERTGKTYAAGMWLEEMPSSLLWWNMTAAPQRGRSFQAEQNCVPSWSWAYTQGPRDTVRFLNDQEFELEILRANINLTSADPYGRVSSGCQLFVKGRLRTARLVKGLDFDLRRFCTFDNEEDRPHHTRFDLESDEGCYLGAALLDYQRDDFSPLAVYCLEVKPDEGYMTYYLVLEQVGDTDEFRRLGIGNYYDSDNEERTDVFGGIDKTEVVLV